MGLDVLDFDLKSLSAERLAVEPHIVEVCACVIDDFFASKATKGRLQGD